MTTEALEKQEQKRRVVGKARPRRAALAELVERYTLPALLVLIVIFFSVDARTSAIFPSILNVNTVLGNQAVLAVVALGSIAPLVAGQFDLSIGAVLGCSGLVTGAAIVDAGLPIIVAVALGVMFGVLIGLLNGFLVAYVGVNAFIGTLGVSTALAGLAIAYSPNPIIDIPQVMTDFGRYRFLGLSILVPLVLVVAVTLYFVLDYTMTGRRLTAVGSSRSAASLVGISVKRTVCGSFVLSGGLAGLAGVLQVCRSGSADAAIGNSFLLPALAAAFLGATALRPGRFNIGGTLIAILFLAAAVSGLTLSGVEPWIQDVFTGASLVVGVSISALIRKRDTAL